MTSNKVLARALVKMALSTDKQAAVNAADAAQFCGSDTCSAKELTDEERVELINWVNSHAI